MNMHIKAILFDLDGTLLDSLQDLAESMNTVLGLRGHAPHEKDAYRYFVGDGITNLVKRALPVHLAKDEAEIETCKALMSQVYSEHAYDHTKLYDGIATMLDACTKHKLLLTVVSNKPHANTCALVAKMFPAWHFPVVLGARPGIPHKPDPAGALEAAAQLQIAPEEFLYLGDTGTDMQTAVAAGMFPVGVLWGFRAKDELITHGAKVCIEHPTDLMQILDNHV